MSQSYQNHWPKTMAYTILRGSYLFSLATATSSCPETAPIPVKFRSLRSTFEFQFANLDSSSSKDSSSWDSYSLQHTHPLATVASKVNPLAKAIWRDWWLTWNRRYESLLQAWWDIGYPTALSKASLTWRSPCCRRWDRYLLWLWLLRSFSGQGRLEIWCPSCLTFDIDEFICSQRVDGSEVLITMWSTMLSMQIRKESMRWIHIEIIKLTSSHAPNTQKHIAVARKKDITLRLKSGCMSVFFKYLPVSKSDTKPHFIQVKRYHPSFTHFVIFFLFLSCTLCRQQTGSPHWQGYQP